jgi:hypothetical protein
MRDRTSNSSRSAAPALALLAFWGAAWLALAGANSWSPTMQSQKAPERSAETEPVKKRNSEPELTGELTEEPIARPAPIASSRLAAGVNDDRVVGAVTGWLECDRCAEGQLERVVAQGDDAVPLLAVALSDGLSPAARELLRRHLVRVYFDLSASEVNSGRRPIDHGGLSAFLDDYLGAADRRVQTRVREALRAINTEAAHSAFDAVE